MAEAIVFDIQRFCIHDGPGIRTVVFLKGCPLRCQWCANPESQAGGREILFDPARCIGCRSCLAPELGGAMTDDGGRPLPDRRKSPPPGFEDLCPSLAIRVAGKTHSVDALMEEVLKDEAFFRESGGGVTFSGGEPLLHGAFLLECVERLRGMNISVAIESCLAVSGAPLDALLSHPIHWLLDLKQVDSEVFREKTGGDLAMVLSNFRAIAAAAPKLTIRIPLIPDFNDSDDARRNLFDFIESLERASSEPPELHILPYHDLAAGKYAQLGRVYPYAGKPKIPQEVQDAWLEDAGRRGFNASIGG